MFLTPQQTNTLLETIQRNQAIFIGKELGLELLSEYDKSLLEASGVDWQTLYSTENDSIYSSFHLGMLAQALKDTSAINKLTYDNVKDYIKRGEYIPITKREEAVITSIKNQTLSDIKSVNGKIFQDLNNILVNSSRENQEQFLRNEIEEGLRKKKTLRDIANTISSKTGDWSRNFDRIVEYQANTAYQEGRAAMMEKDDGDDVEVYKLVFASACKHCLKLYTTEGFQSEPRIFKLSVLKANGTNIGRKVDEWKPIVGSTHPFCFTNPKTPIYTSKGFKHIKDIQVGDLVLTHKKRFRKVTNLIFTERKIDVRYNIICKLKHKDRTISLRDITAEHPILANGNWVSAKNIKVGQKLHLLHDKCSYDKCNKTYPIYHRDEVDSSQVDYCSVSCRSLDKSQKRTIEERRILTSNGREKLKEQYPDSEQLHTPESRRKSAQSNGSRNASYLELKLRYFLDKLEVNYKVGAIIPRLVTDSLGKKRYFYPDIYIPSLNIVFEADGENWHDVEKDRLRDLEIKESIGADVFRFSEHEIRNNGDVVFQEIQRIIKNHKGEYSFEHVEVIEVQEVRTQMTTKKLYNFSVEEDESYIVNGLVVHNCRCLLFKKRKGYLWNKSTQSFDVLDKDQRPQLKMKRNPIRVKIAGKEVLV